MLLSARTLYAVSDVNSWDSSGLEVKFTEGDTLDVYLVLIDAGKDQDNKPRGRRYVPASGATLSVIIKSVDDSKTLTKTATQPFSNDGSIWKFTVNGTDALKGTYSLQLVLTQSSVATYGFVSNALSIISKTGSFC
jgi:hypothetical protein